ncbi:hypothetical protein EJB05_53082, partial [Eragrostis curvula]
MAGLSDLDFAPGLGLQRRIRDRFGTSVSPPPSSSGFILVASFSRSALRINVDSVGIVLQSCLGGTAKDFRVSHLKDWCFRFEVHSKAVGFLIYNLRQFTCKSFAIHFALWGGGGPNRQREFAVWSDLQEKEWTLVTPKRSYAAVAKENAHRGQSNRTVFQRLSYPANYHLNYLSDQAEYQQSDRSSVFTRISPATAQNSLHTDNQMGFQKVFPKDHHQDLRVLSSDEQDQGQNLNFELQNHRQFRRFDQNRDFRDSAVNDPINQKERALSKGSFAGHCYRCLAWGHRSRFCSSPVRCRACYNYGHIAARCMARRRKPRVYRIKPRNAGPATLSPQPSPGPSATTINPMTQSALPQPYDPHPPPPPPPRWIGNGHGPAHDRAASSHNPGHNVVASAGSDHGFSQGSQQAGGPVALGTQWDGADPSRQPGANVAAVVAPVMEDANQGGTHCVIEEIVPEQVLPQEVMNPLEHEQPEANDDADGAEHGAEDGSSQSTDLEVIDKPADFPKKRRKRVVPQDSTLLRKSSRLEAINKGFKPQSAATSSTPRKMLPASSAPSTSKKKNKALVIAEPAVVMPVYEGRAADPRAAPPPHLSIGNVQAIAGFCKMQPSAVSDKKLLSSDDDSSSD